MKIYIYEYTGYYEKGTLFIANRAILMSDAVDMRMDFDGFAFLGSVNADVLSDDFRNSLDNNESYFVYHGG